MSASVDDKKFGNIIRRIPTSIFATPQETSMAVQLYGAWQEHKTESNWKIHLEFYQKLAEKYKVKWDESELAPNGEFVLVVREEKKKK